MLGVLQLPYLIVSAVSLELIYQEQIPVLCVLQDAQLVLIAQLVKNVSKDLPFPVLVV